LKDLSKYFVIDFDSTFTQVEALDELVKISLAGKPEADSVCRIPSDPGFPFRGKPQTP
jgi:hypothetical protein